MKAFKFLVSGVFLLLMACNSEQVPASMETKKEEKEVIPHSYAANPKIRSQHLELDLQIDLDKKLLEGSVTHQLSEHQGGTFVLDINGPEVLSVESDDKEIPYELGEKHPTFGAPLKIRLQPEMKSVTVRYKVEGASNALMYLDPEQTAGKKLPFLFTQGQAILTRSWIPVQDDPSVRVTYNARVKVAKDFLVLMSATNPKKKNKEGVYHFEMKQPVPSYLIALAVGDLEFRQIGEKTGVYAEPSLIEKSAWEFGDMDKMLGAAEKLYGTYKWDQYDVIVLPPSFPFGGMENPRLTFATPTILAGDRSLTTLIAHELAHSWSGNLVTNATWEDFWLNEGFTVYFERRIMEELYGRDYSEMLAILGMQDLEGTMDEICHDHSQCCLKLDLKGRDPDEGMTDIAYEKGYSFIRLMEETVGREKFDAFLKNYFSSFAFQTMTTEKFLEHLMAQLPELKSLNIEEWVYKPGLPANCPMPQSDKFSEVEKAVFNWVKTGSLPQKVVHDKWSSHEWLHFLRKLPEGMPLENMQKLDDYFGFTNTGNSEIAFAWFVHSIHSNYETAFPKMEEFLVHVGRRKFLTPLYRLMVDKGMKDRAQDIYKKARSNYHSVSYNTIDDVIGM